MHFSFVTTNLDLALASLIELWTLDLPEIARDPPPPWVVTEGDTAAEATLGGGLISVGKVLSVLGTAPMLTSAVPSVALSLTPVYKVASYVNTNLCKLFFSGKLTTEDWPALTNLSLLMLLVSWEVVVLLFSLFSSIVLMFLWRSKFTAFIIDHTICRYFGGWLINFHSLMRGEITSILLLSLFTIHM